MGTSEPIREQVRLEELTDYLERHPEAFIKGKQ